MANDVVHRAEHHRFELQAGGQLAVLAYERRGAQLVLTHSEVPEALSGQGVGSRLVEGALAIIRGEGLKIVAQCSFVAAYLGRHPESRDLLAAQG